MCSNPSTGQEPTLVQTMFGSTPKMPSRFTSRGRTSRCLNVAVARVTRSLWMAGHNPGRASVPGMTERALDLATDAATLTAALVDVESVSGNEGPLADLVEDALRRCPPLSVLRDGNVV